MKTFDKIRWRTALLAACLGALAAAGFVSTAEAQTDDRAAEARQHFSRGQTLTAEGDWQQAFHEFRTGYELSHRPLFLFNMAECARQGSQSSRARDLYRRYLSEDPEGSMATNAQARLDELEQTGRQSRGNAAAGDQPTREPGPTPDANARPEDTASGGRSGPVPSPAQTARSAAAEDSNVGILQPDAGAADDTTSIFESWPFWAAVGAVVVAGTVTAIAVAAASGGGDDGSANPCVGECTPVDFTR